MRTTLHAVASLLTPTTALPQEAPDRTAILAAVDRHFAGMKARDTTLKPGHYSRFERA